jgi:type I restriction enzyme S subunit
VGKWERVKLGTIGNFKSGGTPIRSKSEYFEGNIPWITTISLGKTFINESDAVEYISAEAIENSSTKLIKENSIMVGIRVGVGKLSVNTVPMCTNQDIISIENINERQIYKPYIVQCIKSYQPYFESQKRGATIQGINSKILRSLDIPLPPLETQKKIAKNLDTAAELLAMYKQQLAELDNLIKSIFYDMFGDPDNNSYGWEVSLLKDIAEIVSGVTKGRKLKETNKITIPYMRVANVQDGHLNLADIKQIEVTDLEIKKYRLNKGDLLMTEGGDPDKLGRCAIWNGEVPLCIHQNHIFRVRLNQEQILPEYASCLIGSLYGKKYFFRAAKQTTGIATINSKQLHYFPMLIPDIKLQHKFKNFVTKIEEQKTLVKKAIDETQYLFDCLMSEYFE